MSSVFTNQPDARLRNSVLAIIQQSACRIRGGFFAATLVPRLSDLTQERAIPRNESLPCVAKTSSKLDCDSELAIEPSMLVAQAIARYTAKVRSTGAKIDTPVAHIFTVRNGKVTRWIGFSDSAAVAAAHTGAAASATR